MQPALGISWEEIQRPVREGIEAEKMTAMRVAREMESG
jgi:hypothetical protein